MIKTTICIRRKEGITREEFFDYWFGRHAKLISDLKGTLKIVRYVQSHSIDNEVSSALRKSRNGPEMYDGIGEAWFKSIEDLVSLGQDESSRVALLTLIQDEGRFIDLAKSPFWVAEEKVIF